MQPLLGMGLIGELGELLYYAIAPTNEHKSWGGGQARQGQSTADTGKSESHDRVQDRTGYTTTPASSLESWG